MAQGFQPTRRPHLVARWHHLHRRTYREKVKLTFARGAALEDPAKLFNSSLDGNTRRAIDFFENEKMDEGALAALVKAAARLNSEKS